MSVFHQESSRYCTKPDEPELFIQPQRIYIAGNHCVELQDAESQFFSFLHTVVYQLLADVASSYVSSDRIACIADMAAASCIIRMQNIQAENFSAVSVAGKPCKRLFPEEFIAAFRGQQFHLRKCLSIFYYLIPYCGRCFCIGPFVSSHTDFHLLSFLSYLK